MRNCYGHVQWVLDTQLERIPCDQTCFNSFQFILDLPCNRMACNIDYTELTYWGLNKMAYILQTTFSNAFSWMKTFEFQIKCRNILLGNKPSSYWLGHNGLANVRRHAVVWVNDDVIKWKHFPRNWPFVRGIHRSRWIPHTKASDAELWCLLWSTSE